MHLGDRFSANIYIVYADMTLREGGPLISQCVCECIIFSQNMEEFNSACKEGSNSVVQPSTVDGSCRVAGDHFVYDMS